MARLTKHRIAWRVFITVWLVYAVLATTNVVRETYLAIALGSSGTVRVDRYLGLHPDLFEIPGRGAYINSNPGTSMVAAIPYAILVRPAIALVTRVRPALAEPKPPATYDDPRPNRTRFMNEARARGLDVVLGLAAIGTAVTVMAPLGAAAAVLLFVFLRNRLADDRKALTYALVYAFATPIMFRSGFLNQNAILAHLVSGAWVARVGLVPRAPATAPTGSSLALTGLLLGFGLVCDYSAIPFLVVFGLWILVEGWNRGGPATAIRDAAIYSAAAFSAIAILFAYQWVAFGDPVWPAQKYMPPTENSVKGWLGFTAPTVELLIGNLFDPRYGLLAFCPLLIALLATPLVRRTARMPAPSELTWTVASFVALLVFASSTQFATLQWNTGVRYMVPAVPLLYIACVPVLGAMAPPLRWSLIGLSGLVTLAVSMTREDIPAAFRLLLSEGPTLPVLTVARKMASGYEGLQVPAGTFWIVVAVIGAVLFLIWRPRMDRV